MRHRYGAAISGGCLHCRGRSDKAVSFILHGLNFHLNYEYCLNFATKARRPHIEANRSPLCILVDAAQAAREEQSPRGVVLYD